MGETANILRRLRTGSAVLLLAALVALGLSFGMGRQAIPDTLMLTAAVSLGTLFVMLHVAAVCSHWLGQRRLRAILDFLEHDGAPGFCTDEDGMIRSQNRASRDQFGSQDGATMTRVLERLFANPDAVVHRLRLAAEAANGVAREDVVTRRGHVRVAVHRVAEGYLWRLEDLVDRPPRAADGIGLRILTFGPSGTILYMNEVLRSIAGRRVKRLRDLFEEVPLSNGGLNRLLTKSGGESVRVVLSEPVNGRQEVFVLPATESAEGQVALDALPVALLRLDADGTIVFANRLARELLPATATGSERRLAAMVEGLGRSVREWVSEAAAGRGLYRAEVVRITGAEVETYLQITLGRPLSDGEGGLLAVLNDATELKTLEAQFVQSQKMQAIGQLAGGVAHDFNNLLTAISGHCDLLLLRHGEGDEDHADLTQITQNSNRAAALVGQLLAFSRKQTLEMKQVDLRDTLGDLAHLLNRLVGERVTLRLEHDPALLPIRGDRRQLEQVLMNLVVNSRDAMSNAGEILIETECRYLDAPMIRDRVTVPSGQYVVVSVSDKGAGISPDNLGRIFEPFFSTKRPGEGTGLGLSMAYGIVKQSGGYIFADSVLNEGTRFSLFFPALSDEVLDGSLAHSPKIDKVAVGNDPFVLLAGPATVDRAAENECLDVEEDIAVAPGPASLGSIENEDLSADEILPEESAISDAATDQANIALAVKAALRPESDVDDGSSQAISSVVDKDELATSCGSNTSNLQEAEPDGPVSEEEVDDLAATNDTISASRPVVLLVEDEAPVRAFASRALRLRGYEVREAEDAESALAQLEDQTMAVDLFVTDVVMPGLDGPTWVREAMKKRPNVRTVFMSGYTQDAMSETSIPIPNSIFLPKPFSLSDLTRTVERALT